MYLLVLFRQKKSRFFLKKIQINALADLKNLLYQQKKNCFREEMSEELCYKHSQKPAY